MPNDNVHAQAVFHLSTDIIYQAHNVQIRTHPLHFCRTVYT